MRKKISLLTTTFLLTALSLSACSSTSGAPSSAPTASAASSAGATSSASASTPTPAETPANVPNKGLYLLLTGEPGEAEISIVHYYGGDSEAQRKDGDNYKEQALKVKVPSYVEVKLDNLSQISEKTTKEGQSLGCDFVYNGEFRPKLKPAPTETDRVTMCHETGFANTH